MEAWEQAVLQSSLAAGSAAPIGLLPPIPVLYVENDGTAAPMRKGELAGRNGKQPGTDPKGREVKLGCVFTQCFV